jgi:Mg2+/Co2+ transporter CorB
MKNKIKELALSDLGTTLMFLVEEVQMLRDGLVRRSQIVDAQIADMKTTREEMQGVLEEWREEIVQFKMDRQICGQLNILADHQPTKGEDTPKGNQENGRIKVNIVERS